MSALPHEGPPARWDRGPHSGNQVTLPCDRLLSLTYIGTAGMPAKPPDCTVMKHTSAGMGTLGSNGVVGWRTAMMTASLARLGGPPSSVATATKSPVCTPPPPLRTTPQALLTPVVVLSEQRTTVESVRTKLVLSFAARRSPVP